METTLFTAGMVFLANDKIDTNDTRTSMHNYVVLGSCLRDDMLGMVQCMSITSMANKEVTTEVPIKMHNGMVSYIVPYNIHSFLKKELHIRNFKGILEDTVDNPRLSFVKMLLDLYQDNLGMYTDHDEIMERYNQYIDEFWKKNDGVEEYRENKFSRKPYTSSYSTDEKEVICTTDELAEPEEVTITEDEEDECDVSILIDAPLDAPHWSDAQLLAFYKNYKKLGFKGMATKVPGRWKTPSGISKAYSSVKKEVETRNLDTVKVTASNSGIPDQLLQPASDWSDIDLLRFYSIMDNHKDDYHFLIGFTGFKTISRVRKLLSEVSHEIEDRKLEV